MTRPTTQMNMFGDREAHTESLPGGRVALRADFLTRAQADWLMDRLLRTVNWRQDQVRIFGQVHDVPRLHQWFADDGQVYTWSGLRMEPEPWPASLVRLRDKLAEDTGHVFNTALANLYRDGRDTVGWHADDEPELGAQPVIASVSLGVARDFQLRHRFRKDLPTRTVSLPHGSLLLMSGDTQRNWLHCVPRRKRVTEPRVNLTFRQVVHTGP